MSSEKPLSFQGLILKLHDYWSRQGCVILQPHDVEVGAGQRHRGTNLAPRRASQKITKTGERRGLSWGRVEEVWRLVGSIIYSPMIAHLKSFCTCGLLG